MEFSPTTDILLSVDRHSARYSLLSRPYGMSGGGMWDFGEKVSESSDLNFDKCKITGIQSRSDIFDDMAIIKGVNIFHWLRLVHKVCQDKRAVEVCQEIEQITGFLEKLLEFLAENEG